MIEKKIAKKPSIVLPVAVIFLSLLSCSPKYLKRGSLGRELAFTKVFVLPFFTGAKDQGEYSELAQDTAIKEIRKSAKLDALSFGRVRRVLRRLSLSEGDFQNPDQLRRLAKATRADAVLFGKMEPGRMDLKLVSPFTGTVFMSVSEEVSERFTSHSTVAITILAMRRLLEQIPFDALIERAGGKKIEISAGSRSGLRPGMRVTVFEIVGFRKNQLRSEYKKRLIAKAVIKDVRRKSATGFLVKHNRQFQIQKYNKVSFDDFFSTVRPGEGDLDWMQGE